MRRGKCGADQGSCDRCRMFCQDEQREIRPMPLIASVRAAAACAAEVGAVRFRLAVMSALAAASFGAPAARAGL
jgi:hypothetical protein